MALTPAGLTPHLSIVVPLFNERDNIEPLVAATKAALGDANDWELILVDDGSTDGTTLEVRRAAREDPRIRLLRLVRNYGQTAALQAGFEHARGAIVVSMDGDLQNDPADIPRLVGVLEQGDFDLVAGYREDRKDPFTRRLSSALGNAVARALTGVSIRDTGCTLRAYRRKLLDGFFLYSDMHRFIPAAAAGLRGARLTEIPVSHAPRRRGTSKYGFSRAPLVLNDLLVLAAIQSFRERPLVMFARGAMIAILAAMLSAIPALVIPLASAGPTSLILPALPFIWLQLAGFLVLLGLIAEVVLRRHRVMYPGTPALVRQVR
ncbi:MAG: glycosyltransferase family 2 protein [Gemmatimonadota bacterium]